MVEKTLQLLGPIRVVWQQGHPPRFRSPRTQALLGYLVVKRRPIARDKLALLFWPDEPLADGRAGLRRDLHNLTQLLPDCWQIDRRVAHFIPSNKTRIDLDQVRNLEKNESWVEAAELIGGEFLEGLYLPDNLEFESWLLGERERWRQRSEQVLLQAAETAQQQDDYGRAHRYLTHLLQLVPWLEEGHRRLMQLLAKTGRFSEALNQYQRCRTILADELGVSPAPATEMLQEQIKIARKMPLHNLPSQDTPFIGREQELALLQQRLANPNCRLLTLTGIGGIGKSRLALQVAHDAVAGDYRLFLHGVVFVPLVGVDGQDLIAAIGRSLGIAFSGQQTAERQLLNYLQNLELLLLLDNYEHLLPETSLPATILGEAPGVKLLVTSRERLELQEEWLYEVDGLPYPELAENEVLEKDSSDFAAINLFTSCARRMHRIRSLDVAHQEVAAICRLVQGLPLALELSAARLRNLTPSDILAELERGLDILTAETRNTSHRHASLRAAFDVSWIGLSVLEQKVLSQLSLFRSGFTHDAAEKVAGATVALLSSLTEKSLIRLTPSGRYEMHELLRQYAAEKLGQQPTLKAEAEAQFGAYYGRFLHEREQRLLEIDQETALDEIEPETDNIRLMWRWATVNNKLELIEGIIWTIAWFYNLRSRFVEALEWVENSLRNLRLAEGKTLDNIVLARLSLFRGFFLYRTSKLEESRKVLNRNFELIHHCGKPLDISWNLYALGEIRGERGDPEAITFTKEAASIASSIHWLQAYIQSRTAYLLIRFKGDISESQQLLMQALATARRLDNPLVLFEAYLLEGYWFRVRNLYQQTDNSDMQALIAAQRINDLWASGIALHHLGYSKYMQGDFSAAWDYYAESRIYTVRSGDKLREAMVLFFTGNCSRVNGDINQSLKYYERTLELFQETGKIHHYHMYWLYCRLGHAWLQKTDNEVAAAYFQRFLHHLDDDFDRRLIGLTLAGIAGIVLTKGDPVKAGQLVGAAQKQFESAFVPLEPVDRQDWERIRMEIKGHLDEKNYAISVETGKALSSEESISLALEQVE